MNFITAYVFGAEISCLEGISYWYSKNKSILITVNHERENNETYSSGHVGDSASSWSHSPA